MIKKIYNIFTGLGKNFRNRREQKRKIAEQERKEEIERLDEKQQANKVLISAVKSRLTDLQKAFKELEDEENKVSAMYDDIKEKIYQIDILNEKPPKFIFKLMNDAKIKKLAIQCDKQKKLVKKSEDAFNTKKDELSGYISVLSDSFKDL